ncbi:hypothetical protein [Spiroplasma endosymbiont of Virgichneumon dumeticola]
MFPPQVHVGRSPIINNICCYCKIITFLFFFIIFINYKLIYI